MAKPSISDILTNKAPAGDSLPIRDIHLAAPADFWPLAWGWWGLMLLLLVVGIWLVRRLRYRARLKNRWAQIVPRLRDFEARLENNPDNDAIAQLNTLLRQIAVNYYPRKNIASLTGKAWLDFLDQSGETKQFSLGVGIVLAEAPYQTSKPLQIEQTALINLVEEWINTVLQQGKPQ